MNVKILKSGFTRHEMMNKERQALSKENTIWVQEEVVQDEKALGKARADVNSNIYCKLLTFDEVIPLGFSAENAITCLKNQNYKTTDDEASKKQMKFKHHVYHFNKPLAKYEFSHQFCEVSSIELYGDTKDM